MVNLVCGCGGGSLSLFSPSSIPLSPSFPPSFSSLPFSKLLASGLYSKVVFTVMKKVQIRQGKELMRMETK